MLKVLAIRAMGRPSKISNTVEASPLQRSNFPHGTIPFMKRNMFELSLNTRFYSRDLRLFSVGSPIYRLESVTDD